MDDEVAALQSNGAGARSKGDVSIAEDGTVRRSADTSLESMLEAISARLKLFMARLDSTALGPDGAGWLATLGMNQLWDQTVTLVAASASLVERPRPPMSLPLRSDAQVFDPTVAANSSGLAECLRSLMLARAEYGDPNRPDFIPRDLHTRLAKISAELDQHVAQLHLCNPEGLPPGLDDAQRLVWRIECVSARAMEVQSAVSRAVVSARRAEQTGEPVPEHLVRDLDRARWAYVNAMDDAEKDIDAVVRLIDPAHSVMLHKVNVELRANLDELRSWDLVAMCAVEPMKWLALGKKVKFPTAELVKVIEIQRQVSTDGWQRALCATTFDQGSVKARHLNPAERVFRKQGAVWELKFDGESGFVPHRRGLADIALLLRSPNPVRPTPALVLNPSRSGELAQFAKGAPDPAIDSEGMRRIKDELENLQDQRKQAVEAGATARIEEVDARVSEIQASIGPDLGRGGRSRDLCRLSESSHARKVVRKRIDDAIAALRAKPNRLVRLAAHLKLTILTDGDCLAYSPGEGAGSWELF